MTTSGAVGGCSSPLGFAGSSLGSISRSVLSPKGMAICAIAFLTFAQSHSVDAILPGAPVTVFAMSSLPAAGALFAAINPAAAALFLSSAAFFGWAGLKWFNVPPLPEDVPRIPFEKASPNEEYVTLCI